MPRQSAWGEFFHPRKDPRKFWAMVATLLFVLAAYALVATYFPPVVP
jgi:hypothetical protein